MTSSSKNNNYTDTVKDAYIIMTYDGAKVIIPKELDIEQTWRTVSRLVENLIQSEKRRRKVRELINGNDNNTTAIADDDDDDDDDGNSIRPNYSSSYCYHHL